MARPVRIDSGPAGRAGKLPLGRSAEDVRRRVEALEKLLEHAFIVPGINQPVGMDFIVGLVPVAGDAIAAALGAYMVWEARNLGMSKTALARMAGNVGLDWLVGLVPFVGDAADFFFRSNTRNLRIIKRHLDKHYPSTVTLDQRGRDGR